MTDAAAWQPRPRLLSPPIWRWSHRPKRGRILERWMPDHERWSQEPEWRGLVLERLEAGCTDLDQIVAAVGGETMRHPVRIYLFLMWRLGHLDLGFPEVPPWPRYERVRELGRGAVGIAWLCRSPAGEPVVVKHAWDYFVPMAEADATVRVEADLLAAFDHPGIARRLDVFEHRGLAHLVRAYVDGPVITQAVRPRGPVPAPALRDVLGIVAHVHARGYCLLDLQPENLLLAPGPVIVDVGTCRPLGAAAVSGPDRLPAPGFTAPEALEGRAGPAADVFALGRLFFQLRTGRPPKRSDTPERLAADLKDDPLTPLVRAACDPDPAARPTLDEIDRLLETLG